MTDRITDHVQLSKHLKNVTSLFCTPMCLRTVQCIELERAESHSLEDQATLVGPVDLGGHLYPGNKAETVW